MSGVAELCLTLCDPMAIARLVPSFISRQDYWSQLPFPSPGDLPNPGIKPRSPALQADTLPSEPQSAPGLVSADCIELLHLQLQKCNQSDFGIDHLVMSMYRVLSCVIGRRCLL